MQTIFKQNLLKDWEFNYEANTRGWQSFTGILLRCIAIVGIFIAIPGLPSDILCTPRISPFKLKSVKTFETNQLFYDPTQEKERDSGINKSRQENKKRYKGNKTRNKLRDRIRYREYNAKGRGSCAEMRST